jgi:hypothetical protein
VSKSKNYTVCGWAKNKVKSLSGLLVRSWTPVPSLSGVWTQQINPPGPSSERKEKEKEENPPSLY